jgi:hypothetical protein
MSRVFSVQVCAESVLMLLSISGEGCAVAVAARNHVRHVSLDGIMYGRVRHVRLSTRHERSSG